MSYYWISVEPQMHVFLEQDAPFDNSGFLSHFSNIICYIRSLTVTWSKPTPTGCKELSKAALSLPGLDSIVLFVEPVYTPPFLGKDMDILISWADEIPNVDRIFTALYRDSTGPQQEQDTRRRTRELREAARQVWDTLAQDVRDSIIDALEPCGYDRDVIAEQCRREAGWNTWEHTLNTLYPLHITFTKHLPESLRMVRGLKELRVEGIKMDKRWMEYMARTVGIRVMARYTGYSRTYPPSPGWTVAEP